MMNLEELQDLFNNAEQVTMDRLDGLPVFGNYKQVLRMMLNIEDNIFEMLYDEDTENAHDYELENINLTEIYEHLQKFE